MTAGTMFDRRRTPLTVWFEACWMFASQKDGISALSLQRSLEIGSYQTAWAMLHRLRSVLVRPGRDRLTGTVEVDETYIGGEEPGLRGGRAKGKKSLVGVAVEVHEPRGYRTLPDGDPGRCVRRLAAPVRHRHTSSRAHASSPTAGRATAGIDELGYIHEPRSQRAARARGDDPGELLPGGAPRRLPGQAVAAGHPPGLGREAHLQSYLDEFVFRFNRRRSRSRGMVFYRVLELAVGHAPVRYRDLVADPQPKAVRPVPPGRGGHPPSLDRPRAARPWRAADLR